MGKHLTNILPGYKARYNKIKSPLTMVSDKPESWTYTQKQKFNFKKLSCIDVKYIVYVVISTML